MVQDKFDHDKGQKSAISGRRLHWRLSTGCFAFFSSIYVRFSKTSPLKSGESNETSSGENRVKSCHVSGCHGFFGPEWFSNLNNDFDKNGMSPRHWLKLLKGPSVEKALPRVVYPLLPRMVYPNNFEVFLLTSNVVVDPILIKRSWNMAFLVLFFPGEKRHININVFSG